MKRYVKCEADTAAYDQEYDTGDAVIDFNNQEIGTVLEFDPDDGLYLVEFEFGEE